MNCPHTHVFFNSNGSGICLDCDGAIERSKAFDVPKQKTTEPTEAQLLRAELDFAVQETKLLRTALATQIALVELERSTERNPDQYFWAHTRLSIHYQSALKHANELAVDRDTTSQKRKSL